MNNTGACCHRSRSSPQAYAASCTVVSTLGKHVLQLSLSQKQQVYRLLVRRIGRGSSNWQRRPGQLVRLAPVPLSLDLSAVGRFIPYFLVDRPHQLVESNPSICSGQPMFRGTRIPVAVVVERLRAVTPRQELELDYSPAELAGA